MQTKDHQIGISEERKIIKTSNTLFNGNVNGEVVLGPYKSKYTPLINKEDESETEISTGEEIPFENLTWTGKLFPDLMIFLRSLFVDSSKTRLLSVILLNFILVCAKQFGNKNNFPILSCLLNDVLRAILKFPQNADLLIRFLLPFINVCITIIPSAELPGNFLRVIVSVMVVIKAGHFENIFNHSLALHLATILQTMITWYRTSIDQSFQDQVLEVCLSIAMNCNSEIITSNFQSILTPVVYALNRNNSDLVLKALKVLQAICHLNNGFINSHFLSLRMELVHGLHHALKIPSDETKEIIFHLLTQFHDHGQNFQIQQFLMQR
ncbi:hypothetical protein TNIN_214351 [Trichonephila inaurata madagascariensis]|uniref:Uncharacterized protein n=1 Tax=Trichonephila inaurata madagascariensis TaxID=2747483 RepID=A0A8X7BQT7_9ARAC|nr:hypothetical protein TNIN_214351 [Trichonephila inaurata madagascariensis]